MTIATGSVTNVTSTSGNVTLTGGTVTNVTSTSGNIDLKEYTAGTLNTLTTGTGMIQLSSEQNIVVGDSTLKNGVLSGDITYTVTAKQTDGTADLTFNNDSGLTYTDAVTVNMTSALLGVGESYKLMNAKSFTFSPDWGISLSVDGGTSHYDLALDDKVQIGEKYYWLKVVDGPSGTGTKDLVITI